MLLHLQIRDFAIVPSLEQDFHPGFTAISGETGAGKSILVDALGLLLGARSDSAWVRPGADKAELSAEFSVATNSEALEWLAEQELETDDVCLLRRTIAANGRSRAWVNGTPVTVQQLAALGNLLVELHGQNEHVRLTGARRQRELLDATGEYGERVERTARAFEAWREVRLEFERLEERSAATPDELDLMRFQLQELEQVAVTPDELDALEREHRVLARSGDLLEALDHAVARVDDDEHGATHSLGIAVQALEGFRDLDDRIEEACRMLEEARINCREAVTALQAACDRVDLSPDRLEEVERSLDAMADLSRKHRVPLEGLTALRDDIGKRLEDAEGFEERRAKLQREIDTALDTYRREASELSEARAAHATTLSERVQDLMAELGMAGGRFEIAVTCDAGEPARHGDDRVDIRVSANPGVPPGPLAKVASGGELSRISLAIKVACANPEPGRTQVFDEVDAGIGGDTANAVGRMLRTVSAGGQALCVTHLAQVAVRADCQLQVRKETGGNRTLVDARVLEDADRVEEIARMLGGTVSEQSRAHAREMLDAARGAVH